LRLASYCGLLALLLAGCARKNPPPASPSAPARSENDPLALGNPSQAGDHEEAPDNFLVARPQFVLAYNGRNGGPNWVAWHLQKSDLGSVERADAFRPDPLLPEEFQIRPGDYQGSGFDRGHQCPSGDRTDSAADNAATFVMSNMLPQTADLNREVWRKLEEYCRLLAGRGNEMYIVCGGHGTRQKIAQGRVNVPQSCWKVVLVLPQGDNDVQRISDTTRVIAVDVTNVNGIKGRSWRRYLTTVDAIERATGYDFLASVPTGIQATLEAKVDSLQRERRSRQDRRRED
jgi:endonuclease G, mitochondrial